MSVLTDGHSLIVLRSALEEKYPGGADAFVGAMETSDRRAYHVCGDEQLVSVCFLMRESCKAVEDELVALRVVGPTYFDFEFVEVDQAYGPPSYCNWLDWCMHADGYSFAWIAGNDSGEMAVPPGWEPEHSRQLARSSIAGETAHRMQLSVEDDRETWLDLYTGEIGEGMARNTRTFAEDRAAEKRVDDVKATMKLIRSMLDAGKKSYDVLDHSSIAVNWLDTDARRELYISVRPNPLTILCGRDLRIHIPEHKRAEIAELMLRLNVIHPLCTFEMNVENGQCWVRQGVLIEGTTITPQYLKKMCEIVLLAAARYHGALCLVIEKGMSPVLAIAKTRS